ncbi:MASE3 domain-containing protein [Pseudoneobacillus sp. C159]
MTESKFMGYTLFSVLIFILIHIFQPHILTIYNPMNYLGFHTILEVISIALSAYIFMYGWRMFATTKMRGYLMLSTIFFLVGVIDLFHTITFNGMPYFFSDSSIPKATWFWVVARSIEAVLILVFLLLPNKQLKKDFRPAVLTISCFVLLFIIGFIYHYEKSLPSLVIEGKGTTLLKNTIEYFVSFFHFVAIVLMLYRYFMDKKESHLYNALAFTFLFLSELVFTIYQSVYDVDNFVGHIFKVCGYYFIMKGFLFTPEPMNSIEQKSVEESAVKKIVLEQDGILFRVIKQDGDLVYDFCHGGLLDSLGVSPSAIIGKTIQEVIPYDLDYTVHYYFRAWNTGETVQFTIQNNDRTFFYSLKPLQKNGIVTEMIGTIVDITFVQQYQKQVRNL